MAHSPAADATITLADIPDLTGDPVKDRLSALRAYQRITQRWVSLVDNSEPEAYGRLRKDLMDYGALMVSGGLMSAKEHLDKLEDLQQPHLRVQDPVPSNAEARVLAQLLDAIPVLVGGRR